MADPGEVRVVLGNRDARNLDTHAIDKARAIDKDTHDPRRLHDEDEERGLARLSVPVAGKQATLVVLPPGTTLAEAFLTVTAPGGVWASSTHGAGSTAPAWVASDEEALAVLLVSHWGCPRRDLDEEALAAVFGPGVAR